MLAALAFVGHVFVVGPGPTELAEIQAAVDVASDGDVVLVKSGTYASFVVVNKALAIVADEGANVVVTGAVRARNLSASNALLFSGLRANGATTANAVTANGLFLTDCAGIVTAQDCTFHGVVGAAAPCGAVPAFGAEVRNSQAVVLERCDVRGSQDVQINLDFASGGHGLRATNSNVAAYSSNLEGGRGGIACLGYAGDGGPGGDGARLSTSTLVAQDTTLRGGAGANTTLPVSFAGSGGTGVVTLDGSCVVHRYSSMALPGAAGHSSNCGICGSCCSGSPGGTTSYAPGTTFSVDTTTPRDLVLPAVARESTTVNVTVRGRNGDVAGLAIRASGGFAFDPALHGVSTLGSGLVRYLVLGTLAGESLSTTLPLGAVPANGASRLFLQSLHLANDGTRWLGDPRQLVVLDSAY